MEGGIEKLPMVKDQPVSWLLANVQVLITESKPKYDLSSQFSTTSVLISHQIQVSLSWAFSSSY